MEAVVVHVAAVLRPFVEVYVAYVAAALRHFVVRKAAAALLAFATGILMTTGLAWTARYVGAWLVEVALGLWEAVVEAGRWLASGARWLYRLAAFYWQSIVFLGKWAAFFVTALGLGIYFSYDFFANDPRASDVTDAVTDGFTWLAAQAVGVLRLQIPNATSTEVNHSPL